MNVYMYINIFRYRVVAIASEYSCGQSFVYRACNIMFKIDRNTILLNLVMFLWNLGGKCIFVKLIMINYISIIAEGYFDKRRLKNFRQYWFFTNQHPVNHIRAILLNIQMNGE